MYSYTHTFDVNLHWLKIFCKPLLQKAQRCALNHVFSAATFLFLFIHALFGFTIARLFVHSIIRTTSKERTYKYT